MPKDALIVDAGAGPTHYKFAKAVTYVNADGQNVEDLKLKKNLRVRLHCATVGPDTLVDKVALVEKVALTD